MDLIQLTEGPHDIIVVDGLESCLYVYLIHRDQPRRYHVCSTKKNQLEDKREKTKKKKKEEQDRTTKSTLTLPIPYDLFIYLSSLIR